MNGALLKLTPKGPIAGLALALALWAPSAASGAQAHSPPRPQAAATPSDPLGALLRAQASADSLADLPLVIGFGLTEAGGHSRLTLELSDPLDMRVFTLTAPDRVVIDMPEVLWRMPGDLRPSGKGAVKSYRYGQFRKGNSRLVIDLNRPVKPMPSEMKQPEAGSGFKFVLDLDPATAAEFASSAGWPKDLQAASFSPPAVTRPAFGGKRVIVIDPGHGGIDPGTHGESGVKEKDLVLAVARALRKSLEATGRYRVQLTRDSDVFIPLRERVNIARAAHGDLFVSLHADSNDHREIRGASVYTLSEAASDREAAKLAEKENMSDAIAGVDLAGDNNPVASILIDLAQRGTINRSARFAESLVGTLPSVTAVQHSSPHRSAGFAVLKSRDMPAVLVELGYLTNTQDENEMATEAWREKIARALAASIDANFGGESGPLPRQAAIP